VVMSAVRTGHLGLPAYRRASSQPLIGYDFERQNH
jgi:hypothetical protein